MVEKPFEICIFPVINIWNIFRNWRAYYGWFEHYFSDYLPPSTSLGRLGFVLSVSACVSVNKVGLHYMYFKYMSRPIAWEAWPEEPNNVSR